MSVFEVIVDVSGQAAFPTNPQVVIPFEPRTIAVFNEDSNNGDDAFVSFDGQTTVGHVIAGSTFTYTQRVLGVWLRRGAIGAPPTNIQVIAES